MSEDNSCQYAMVAGGFLPSPATIPKLEAGVYSVEPTMIGTIMKRVYIQTDHLIRIDSSPAMEVINEIKRFWTLKEKFQKFGYLHKRGFLLYGPPGTGKTTTLNIVMEDVVKNDGVIVIGNADIDSLSTVLKGFRQVEPDRQLLVVFEDLDNVVRRNEAELLALLDGDAQVDNVVYLATTNYIERLPPRVIERPSRFDKKIAIDAPSPEAQAAYLRSRGIDEASIALWVPLTKGMSMAHLKELIISVEIFGNPIKTEVKRLGGGKSKPVDIFESE